MTHSHYKKTVAARGSLALIALFVGGAGVAGAQEDAGTRYARLVADAAITARYNTQIQQQVRSQESEMAALQQQLDGLDATAEQVEPLLQRMFEQLDQFVKADIPFLPEEREQRIERLRDIMGRVETTAAEKYRRLLEAYQIEMEYGRTMDSYKHALADGRDAEFVRLGRVTLLYRTADGKETGYWDAQQKAFVPDENSARAIDQALRIAKQETAPDLITVPVPAPTQGGRS
jgi:predicted RNase H-like nuclease (RuvC/YqgF family)